MKKNLFISLFSLSIFLMVTSCSKSNSTPSVPGYEGFWEGQYGSSSSYPTNGYAFLYKANGTCEVFDGADTATANKAIGTYTVTGSTINTTYTYTSSSSTFSTTATINSENTFEQGTWGSGTNTTNGGNYFIVKQ